MNRVEGMKFQLNDNPHAEEIPCTYHTHFHGRIQLQETGMVPHRRVSSSLLSVGTWYDRSGRMDGLYSATRKYVVMMCACRQ